MQTGNFGKYIHVWDIRREVGTRLEPIELDDLKTGVL